MPWEFACPDWPERLRAGRSLLPDLPLVAAEATRAVAIFDRLRLPDVPGQPAMAEAAGDWQRDMVRALFGSLVGGNRMVPELFCMVPKKNSKTTGGAALTLTGLLMNVRPRAEFIYVGPTQEVADLAFQQSVGMIEADEYLAQRFHVAHHTKTITDRRNKARLKVKTFDMKVVTGSKPAFVLLDELHLMAQMNGAGRIVGQIRGGMLANPEAVLVMITTQSDQPPAGVFKAELEYARGVRDGRITGGRMLPVIYEFPRAMQANVEEWRNPANWPMVLPNLGRSITIDRLVADYRASVEKGDEEERRWASQHLNIQIGVAMNAMGWAGAEFWEGCEDSELVTLAELKRRSEVAVIGIDGGGLDDLLGLVVLGRCRETRRWLLWVHAWAHEIVLERRKDIAEALRGFAKAGELTLVGLPGEDVEAVADICCEVRDAGLLPEKHGIGVDAAGIGDIVDELTSEARGFALEMIAAVSQGWKLNSAIKTAERKLAGGELVHGGSGLMAWCVGNAKAEQKGNGVMITKQVAGSAKIDPLMAMFNAVTLMALNPEAGTRQIRQGFVSL